MPIDAFSSTETNLDGRNSTRVRLVDSFSNLVAYLILMMLVPSSVSFDKNMIIGSRFRTQCIYIGSIIEISLFSSVDQRNYELPSIRKNAEYYCWESLSKTNKVYTRNIEGETKQTKFTLV